MLFKTKHIVFTTDFSSFYMYENESDEQEIKISNADRSIHILFNISDSQCIITNKTDCNFLFPISTYIYGEIKSKEFSILKVSNTKHPEGARHVLRLSYTGKTDCDRIIWRYM